MTERNVYQKPESRVLLRTADVYQTEAEDDITSYSDTLLSIVADFKNSGEPEGSNAQAMVGKSKRGEIACRLFARINPDTGIIEAAGFKTRGCLAMTACASAACLLIQGKGVEEALQVGIEDIRAYVDGVPAGKVNALHYAACAIRALVGDFLLRDGAGLAEVNEAFVCDEGSISCIMAEHCSYRQSRLEKRMEEEEEHRRLVEADALADVFDLVRARSAKGLLTASDDWAGLIPSHLLPDEFHARVMESLNDDSQVPLPQARMEGGGSEPSAKAKPSAFANRGVGIPHLFETDTPSSMPETKRAIPRPDIPAEAPDEEIDLVAPEGYELVQVDGEWGLVASSKPTKEHHKPVDASGIKSIPGKSTVYLYDGNQMKAAFASWAFLGQEGDAAATFAYCVREDSRTYPRPMAESSFSNHPLNMSAEVVRSVWDEVKGLSEYADLGRVEASNGDVYYFSKDYLSEEHAQSLAEWESVERLWNV